MHITRRTGQLGMIGPRRAWVPACTPACTRWAGRGWATARGRTAGPDGAAADADGRSWRRRKRGNEWMNEWMNGMNE